MGSKIIQIIPAPPDMWAIWEPTEKGEKTEYNPVVCLALMEDKDKGTWITPMSIFGDGGVEDVMAFSNFGGISYKKFDGILRTETEKEDK